MSPPTRSAHVDLDGAWPEGSLPLPAWDFRTWGPRLRFCAPDAEMEAFLAAGAGSLPSETRFIVYGSGDFHHLSALWLRRAVRLGGGQPLTLVSFDNHPDWDIRPPKWCCGSWINRALDLTTVEQAAVWGCGNFECWGWHRLTGNHRDVRSGRLEVHPWADGRTVADQARAGSITQAGWREAFARFAAGLAGRALYVTVDIDGLCAGEAVTNWENGRFSAADVAWALEELSRHARIAAGDLCGARSAPVYARRTQRFVSEMDHPELPAFDPAEAARTNTRAFETIWPQLTGEGGSRRAAK